MKSDLNSNKNKDPFFKEGNVDHQTSLKNQFNNQRKIEHVDHPNDNNNHNHQDIDNNNINKKESNRMDELKERKKKMESLLQSLNHSSLFSNDPKVKCLYENSFQSLFILFFQLIHLIYHLK